MEYSTTWILAATKPDWYEMDYYEMDYYNHAADVTYGINCCLCFLLGTVGNIVSFLHFKAKKRDMSSAIYMLITANDVVISVVVVPVGISFLSERSPGIVFGTTLSCKAWYYLWQIAVAQSIFLVLCLSITRTLSLIRPFRKQKIRYLLIAIASYFLLILAQNIVVHVQDGGGIIFQPGMSRCTSYLNADKTVTIILVTTIMNLVYIAPAFAVATSCIITAVLLTRRNNVAGQQELQQSRNRATLTILLFALVYGVCNIPLVVNHILASYAYHTDNPEWYYNLYQFDTQLYYYNAIFTVLMAVNSAANPILYFWRMPGLRVFLKGILRLNRDNSYRRPPNIVNGQTESIPQRDIETEQRK